MHRFKPIHCIAMALIVLVAGCAQSTETGPAEVTHMSRAEVIEIANRAATEAGYRLGDYRVPDAHYQITEKDKTWTVFYEMRPPTPAGGHFLVVVEDEAGKTRVMPGE